EGFTRPARKPPRTDRPVPVPLRPDPGVVHDNAMRALVRSAIAIGINKLEPSNLPRDYVRRMWPGDRDVPLILRAAILPARTADVPLAAVATAFLAALVPVSAGADLLKRGLSLNFDGVASISIPSLGVPAASFVAEDEAIPVQEAPGQPRRRSPFD